MAKWDPRTEFGPGGRKSFENMMQVERVKKIVRSAAVTVPALILVIWASFTTAYTVEPEEIGVVRRLGEFSGTAEPGLHFKLPFGIDRVRRLPAEQQVLKEEFGFRTKEAGERTEYSDRDFGDESLMLTGDLNVIEVTWVVQYRIQDPEKYLFHIREQQETLRDVSEAAMRRIVGNRLGSNVLTVERVEIALKAREEIQSILDSYDAGIEISTIELQDVVPPQRVQPAFNEVNVARQERERMINEAEKRRNQTIPRARGEALQTIAEAEGYAIQRVNRAQGEVARFNAILKEYDAAPDVTRRRLYLETLESMLPEVERIVVMPENGTDPLPLLDLSQKGILQPAAGGKN